MKKNNSLIIKPYLNFLIIISILIVLFEFILPSNNYFPKPSVVIQSYPSLFNDYNLLINFSSTFGIVYLSLMIGIILSKVLSVLLLEKKCVNSLVKKRNKCFWFILLAPLLILPLIWFPDFYLFKMIYALLISTIAFTIKRIIEMEKIDKNYISSIRSLGLPINIIRNKIMTKLVEPAVIAYARDYQFILWLLVLIYEVLIQREGIGIMIKRIVEYRDLSGAIAILFILGFIIILTNIILSKLNEKLSYKNVYE